MGKELTKLKRRREARKAFEDINNKPLKFVSATKSVASTGLDNARRLAER